MPGFSVRLFYSAFNLSRTSYSVYRRSETVKLCVDAVYGQCDYFVLDCVG